MMSDNIQKYRLLSNYLPKVDANRLVIITGARQTGKTTLAKASYPDIKYINLDSPENREQIRTVATAGWGKDIGNAVIDEAQKEPAVFEKIKYAYDARDISFTALLGSSQITLLKKIRESLAGRVSIHELWPLLMSELRSGRRSAPLVDSFFSGGSIGEKLDALPSTLSGDEDSALRRSEDHILKWGGMPALLPL